MNMFEIIVWFNDGLLKRFPKVDEDKIIVDNNSIGFIYGDDRMNVFINLNHVNCIERHNIAHKNEVIQILKEISDDCKERNCDGCKFFTRYGCALKHIPDEWFLDEIGLAESEDNGKGKEQE